MSEANKLSRRPTVHYLFIVVFGLMTLGLFLFLANIFRGRAGTNWVQYIPILFFNSVMALAFFSLVFGRRRRWVYYIVSVCLVLIFLKMLQTASINAYSLMSGKEEKMHPFYHLAETSQPFIEQRHVFPVQPLLIRILTTIGMAYFSCHFAFGTPSRFYFGLADTRFLARARRGKPERGLELLDKIDGEWD